MINRNDFIKVMDKAIETKQGIRVYITIPGCEYPEQIYNPPENVQYKKDYYLANYDEDMKLKHNKDIIIWDAIIAV